jgi:hypothetical protein
MASHAIVSVAVTFPTLPTSPKGGLHYFVISAMWLIRRGRGWTDPWPGDGSDYFFQFHAADLVAFIQGLDAGPVHLVDTSYGGFLVTLVALEESGARDGTRLT